ncbi:cell division protein DedD [Oceanimonas pelagia]|uniref:Cell division protein DedD n=1 Tax=Oceanimonas pelagia TaxID=3028314 RepID=A0AA50KLK8_9GAMM|nr:cell division protein DedD [Oceanimonas pelagia]WMC09267.1 cell division protein DedD [Oceanimonas pelagia]
MATQFQHRLVGTVLLVALGVIFLPDLLDGKQAPAPEEAVSIPLRPELEPPRPARVVSEATPAPAATADNWTLEEVKEAPPEPPKPQSQVAAAPAPKPEPAAEPVRPAPEAKPVVARPQPAPVVKPVAPPAPQAGVIKPVAPAPQASRTTSATPAGGEFVVQLGAFRSADNVNALVRKLQAAGYRVQTTPSVPRQGELNRVWVGPDARARLEQQLPALERLTGLKGRVMAK